MEKVKQLEKEQSNLRFCKSHLIKGFTHSIRARIRSLSDKRLLRKCLAESRRKMTLKTQTTLNRAKLKEIITSTADLALSKPTKPLKSYLSKRTDLTKLRRTKQRLTTSSTSKKALSHLSRTTKRPLSATIKEACQSK